MTIFGFEAMDLLGVLIVAGVCSMIFANSVLALPLGFGLPGALLVLLKISKKNKPEHYLRHLLSYYFAAGFFPAGADSKFKDNMQGVIYERTG